jgi:HEAT repeat protein
MMHRLASLLKIRANEGRLALLVAILFACIQAGQGMGENSASALFLLRFGVDFLPYMYIFLGVLTFVTTLAYAGALGRFDKSRFFSWMIAGCIGLLLLERLAIFWPRPFLYPVLWLSISGMGMILGTFVWNVAGEVCDARQAKRLFPLFTSAGILGSVVGNAVTGRIAKLFGTDNLLILYALLLGIALYLTRLIARDYFHRDRSFKEKTSLWKDMQAGFEYVRRSPLMQLIAYSSILFSVLFFSVSFPFNKVVTASFSDEASMAGFFGLFNSITTAATFLISLFLASRIYARLGIVNAVFVMPFTYMFCFLVLATRYELTGAAIARFAQLVILSGIVGTAWNALFNVVPSQKRGQVLAFNNGVPSQIGVVLSGVLLIVAEKALSVQQIFITGGLVAFVCGILIWRMHRAYAGALVDALRTGRVEVFSAAESTFRGFRGDPAALDVAIRTLHDSKARTRRLSVEMLGRMQATSAIPVLSELLADPDPSVRAATIAVLGELRADSALGLILVHLNDPEEQVRKQALITTAQLNPDLSPALHEKLHSLLRNDVSTAVQMQAAITLARLASIEEVMPKVMDWLTARNPSTRIPALETVGAIALYSDPQIEPGFLTPSLEDPSAPIRRVAVAALANFKDTWIVRMLIHYLADPDASVRNAAARGLRQHGKESRALVLELFESDHPMIDSALDALTPGEPESLAPLRAYARREITRARTLRKQIASLPVSGQAVALLKDRLRMQAASREGRLIKTVGLFGDMHTMELVRKSMHGTNIENRAAALEALDTIGDRKLAQSIVSLLEEEPEPGDLSDVIAVLLKSTDTWVRILAVRSTSELGLREFLPLLQQMVSGSDSLLCEAAQGALAQFREEKQMHTLKTVSKLERILLLREIPIFTDLSTEDLELVASIAREEWYPQNTAISRQGDEGNVMFVIVEGSLHVIRTANGSDQVLAQRGPGDFVGEMAVIESAPRLATLLTQSDVRVLAIDGETFKGILHERPDVSFAVIRNLSRRLREMTE